MPRPSPLRVRFLLFLLVALGGALLAPAFAQVDYRDDGFPWKNKANKGPDKDQDGWYYNLGVTGIRVMLMKDEPKHLLVKHVVERSPASRSVKVGDVLIGVGGKPFKTEHKDGYGMEFFGPDGPILEFAQAIMRCQSTQGTGWLEVNIRRGRKKLKRKIEIGKAGGNFSKTYPKDCKRTDRILKKLLPYLVKEQRSDGSWGNAPTNMFATLALMAADPDRYKKQIRKAVKHQAKITTGEKKKDGSLINWRYMAAGILLAEYQLQTGEKWPVNEMKEIRDFILWSQYMDMKQINPKAYDSHPDAIPKNEEVKRGGWGHNPGHEGYGAISMITAQGALAMSMMKRCDIMIPKTAMEAAFDFLARGTGKNGYLWYEDGVADHKKWADMGRTGASAIANWLYPGQKSSRRKLALLSARCMGDNPQSFPDTHGSPLMGMGYQALGTSIDKRSFRKLMDYNRWWFVLSECPDGSFYYQPNRDNAGYGDRSRVFASAVVAFILLLDEPRLHLTGKPFPKR